MNAVRDVQKAVLTQRLYENSVASVSKGTDGEWR